MSYDLTSFLTTVAASSASIVAILGGFIASKLISISGDRDAVLSRIKSIEEELRFKQSELERRQIENDIEDAESFVDDHIGAVLSRKPIEEVYDTAETQELSIDRLRPYWEKAVALGEELRSSICQSEQLDQNSDKIPKMLAEKYTGDSFSYSVLEQLMRYIVKLCKEEERRQKEEARKKDPFASFIPGWDYSAISDMVTEFKPVRSGWIYTQNEQEISKLSSEINYLNYQREQLEQQRLSLSKPKGMRLGLIIFALFAVACIVIPLALSPRNTESLQVFWTYKITILFLFIAGLAAIFGYLIYLLRWKEDSTENERKEK